VEILPRRGYRFIAPVTTPSVADAPAPPHRAIEDSQRGFQTPDQTRAPRRLTRVWASVLVAAIALVLTASSGSIQAFGDFLDTPAAASGSPRSR
jgi:hypothetical protein